MSSPFFTLKEGGGGRPEYIPLVEGDSDGEIETEIEGMPIAGMISLEMDFKIFLKHLNSLILIEILCSIVRLLFHFFLMTSEK